VILADAGGPGTLMPVWLVLPLAGLLMLLVAAHTLALHRVEMPAWRRRLRTASGAVILLLLPVMAYALCWVSPDDHRAFVLSWMAITTLVLIIMALSAADILGTLRASRRASASLRRGLSAALPGQRVRRDGPGGPTP
jgi:hypothetical protein